MNPIEAVARAIDPGAWSFEHSGNTDRQAFALDKARAALTALRDNGVTEGMVEAWVIVPPTPDCDPAENCANEFRAMLDAALEGN